MADYIILHNLSDVISIKKLNCRQFTLNKQLKAVFLCCNLSYNISKKLNADLIFRFYVVLNAMILIVISFDSKIFILMQNVN